MTKLLRCRFKANKDDPRPVNFPVTHPWWCTGYGDDFAIVVSYANDEAYIKTNWPEASEIEAVPVDGYKFTDRFPKPTWFKLPKNAP